MNDITRIKDALFFLLRQGLWGINDKEDAEKYFPLSPEEWQALYIHSRRQAVQGIVYDGVLLLAFASSAFTHSAMDCRCRSVGADEQAAH